MSRLNKDFYMLALNRATDDILKTIFSNFLGSTDCLEGRTDQLTKKLNNVSNQFDLAVSTINDICGDYDEDVAMALYNASIATASEALMSGAISDYFDNGRKKKRK